MGPNHSDRPVNCIVEDVELGIVFMGSVVRLDCLIKIPVKQQKVCKCLIRFFDFLPALNVAKLLDFGSHGVFLFYDRSHKRTVVCGTSRLSQDRCPSRRVV